MIRALLLLGGMLLQTVYAADFETTFENSNFTLSTPVDGTGEHEWYNYNRFRVTEHIREHNWFLTAIGDVEHHLGQGIVESRSFQAARTIRSDTPFSTQTATYDYEHGELYAELYRLYGGYSDDLHRASIGLQKISMGVGRIWNPTDLFNPKNPLALEPDEVYGVLSASYTYTPNTLTQITAITAQRADESFKHAARIKSYLGAADAGVSVIFANDVSMIGYELEGELLKSGIELRSEGGWFEDKRLEQQFFQGLIGADYTFENSLMVATEWLHTSKTFEQELALSVPSGTRNNLVRSHDYAGFHIGYEFDALLYGTMVMIVNTQDGSFYNAPSLRYSLEDDISLGLGALLYEGAHGSEFGDYGPIYYFNVKVTF